MSLKSSRLRQGLLPPPFQMQPRCTASEGAASTVVQVRPVLYVKATYRCQTPRKSADCVSPVVCVPRNAKAALLSSPAITSANSAFCTPNGVPASLDFDQCSPRSGDDVLRTIINSVRIVDFDRGRGSSVRTAAYRLMIDTCGLAGTLRGEPIVPVIVGKGKFASRASQLRGKGAIRATEMAVVRKED